MNARSIPGLLLLCGCLTCAQADGTKWFAAPAVSARPNLALGLRDPAWDHALKIPFALTETDGDNTNYFCESYWLYAGGSLFAGFKCRHPDSPRLWGHPGAPRDQGIYRNESVELYFGDMDGAWHYQLIVDAYCNIFDANGRKGGREWNGDWKCSVERNDGFWTLVVEAPPSVLEPIRQAGSFLTFNVGRNIFRADGTGEMKTALSPPVFRAPEDKLFLGGINSASIGDKLTRLIAQFRKNFAHAPTPEGLSVKLAELDFFAAACRRGDDVTLEHYRRLYDRFSKAQQDLQELEQETVQNVIFGK